MSTGRIGGDRPGNARLNELVAEAVVDCHDEGEQLTGLFAMIEENLALPFATRVLGVEVTVESVDLTNDDRIVAGCRRGRERQAISLLELPLPSPPPAGAEWIHAYCHWARRQ